MSKELRVKELKTKKDCIKRVCKALTKSEIRTFAYAMNRMVKAYKSRRGYESNVDKYAGEECPLCYYSNIVFNNHTHDGDNYCDICPWVLLTSSECVWAGYVMFGYKVKDLRIAELTEWEKLYWQAYGLKKGSN